ncbi:hypothetical protein [Rhodopirellula sp. MGV]|uniref:hypothetical protein n=1 Tax=Rhodopirellula sp. MGV TaxID=2023130 RepID=UPI000B976D3D|nr:hypothetical protein [Rhodopirellula sp. MGV]OYP31137.1 hypothetical protein CGZ80_21340 [Rhodopirellula sp. MGV]PNY36040.1 hypothetical protein C2E31_15085 [Rhodopirellula baltica]
MRFLLFMNPKFALAPVSTCSQPSVAQTDVNGNWTGCDWETEFGPLKLNLKGIRSRQAMLAASATRGQEAEQWRDAAKWLQALEDDARKASEFWQLACLAESNGEMDQAVRLRSAGDAIEEKYPRHPASRGAITHTGKMP